LTKHPFAVAIRLNGKLIVLSVHATAKQAADACAASTWADAFVVAQ
jgi:hypothetical protein